MRSHAIPAFEKKNQQKKPLECKRVLTKAALKCIINKADIHVHMLKRTFRNQDFTHI